MCWFLSSTVDLGQGLSFILWLFLGITIDYSSVIPFIIVSPTFIMVPLGNSSSFLTSFLSLLLFIILLMNILHSSFIFALTDYWLWTDCNNISYIITAFISVFQGCTVLLHCDTVVLWPCITVVFWPFSVLYWTSCNFGY